VKAIEVWKKVRKLDGPDLTIERWEIAAQVEQTWPDTL
jgi:hypothetical protein